MEAWLKFGRAAVIFTTVMISNSKILNINLRKPIKSLKEKDQVENRIWEGIETPSHRKDDSRNLCKE